MYQDDYINDNTNDDLQDNRKFNNQLLDDIKNADKGYYTWTRQIPGIGKPVKVEAYGSGDAGSRIRDPITGERYRNYIVGSRHEDLFFKVRLSGARLNRHESPTFFYSSPDEYEKHTKFVVEPKTKAKWADKKLEADIRLRKEQEDAHNRSRNYTVVN